MSGLLKRLLSYSRVGRGGLNIVDCRLEAVLHVVLMNLRAQLEATGGRVTYDPLPAVPADETLMVQLLQNLIENATKYRRADPLHVHVSARREPAAWIISVADNGIGIAPEHIGRIFGMFQRVQRDESRYAGTGIGLATCRKIVERHQGRIWVESQPSKGSTFYFSLPCVRPETPVECSDASPAAMPGLGTWLGNGPVSR
jgi:signal transduction histidine kinase